MELIVRYAATAGDAGVSINRMHIKFLNRSGYWLVVCGVGETVCGAFGQQGARIDQNARLPRTEQPRSGDL
jgi:hypothetical protein